MKHLKPEDFVKDGPLAAAVKLQSFAAGCCGQGMTTMVDTMARVSQLQSDFVTARIKAGIDYRFSIATCRDPLALCDMSAKFAAQTMQAYADQMHHLSDVAKDATHQVHSAANPV